jgi:tetratricopeptide (TPR) repeat protein
VVAEVCRRLDGLPLAIEIAAARIKLLPPQAILKRLDQRLKLLVGGAVDLPARQQTLRSTIDWSYNLLKPEEQRLFARLGVFVGGFTLESAESVCGPAGDVDVFSGVEALFNCSLLNRVETATGETRFDMLETIRAYALERLADSGEWEAMREQHARYFGNFITRASHQLFSSKALYWLNWLEAELDNIRATLEWSLAVPQGIALGTELVFILTWFWYRRGYLIEGRTWTERVLAAPAMQAAYPLRGLALASNGWLALWQGQHDIALEQIQESLALVLRQEDEFLVAYQQFGNAVALINMGRDGAAQPLLEAARAYFKENNQSYLHAAALVHLGNAELGLGNPEKARALHEAAHVKAQAINENWLLSFALNNLGEVARSQGQYEQARTYYEACEELLGNTGDRGDLARFAHSLGYVAQHEGDYAQAEAQFRKSLTMFRRMGNRRGMAECMAGLAGLKARQGQAEWGAIMLNAAESVLKGTGGAWWPADRVEVDRNKEIIRSALNEGEWSTAEKKGQAMTLEQALAFASEDL